jgi:hypothetical protein
MTTIYYFWCFSCLQAFACETHEYQPKCTNKECNSRYPYQWQAVRLLKQSLPAIPIPGDTYDLNSN